MYIYTNSDPNLPFTRGVLQGNSVCDGCCVGVLSPDDKMTDDLFHFEPLECNYIIGTERDLLYLPSTVLYISGLAVANYLLHILSHIDAQPCVYIHNYMHSVLIAWSFVSL